MSDPTGARARPVGYLWAALCVALATGVALLVQLVLPLPDVEMLYLLVVLIAAVYLGRGPSLMAAALGVAAYDFFFVPPAFTFEVGDSRHVLTFAMLFGVSFVVSALAGRIRRQETEALAREERTRMLYALAMELASAKTERQIAAVACQNAAGFFAPRAWVVKGPDAAELLAAYPLVGAVLEESERALAREVLAHGHPAGQGTDTLPTAQSKAVPLGVGPEPLAALVLRPAPGASWNAEQTMSLEAFSRQVALALSRAELDARARQADLRASTEEMRSALLSSVSHDLRTPLAAITGSAATLRTHPGLPEPAREELLAAICDEADRLERLLSNLVDMTRLESGAVTLHREWVPVDELVGSALTRLEPRLRGRPVQIKVPTEPALVSIDPVLIEQLLVNLLENAVKHTPDGTEVEVSASVRQQALHLEVADRGPGIPGGDEERIFERFFRHAGPGVSGVGLGLAICRAIARAHGGTLAAKNRPGGGAIFQLTLPPAGPPPVEVRQ